MLAAPNEALPSAFDCAFVAPFALCPDQNLHKRFLSPQCGPSSRTGFSCQAVCHNPIWRTPWSRQALRQQMQTAKMGMSPQFSAWLRRKSFQAEASLGLHPGQQQAMCRPPCCRSEGKGGRGGGRVGRVAGRRACVNFANCPAVVILACSHLVARLEKRSFPASWAGRRLAEFQEMRCCLPFQQGAGQHGAIISPGATPHVTQNVRNIVGHWNTASVRRPPSHILCAASRPARWAKAVLSLRFAEASLAAAQLRARRPGIRTPIATWRARAQVARGAAAKLCGAEGSPQPHCRSAKAR